MTLPGVSRLPNSADNRMHDVPVAAAGPSQVESLPVTTARFGLYLALGVGWYVKSVPGPLAKPLELARRTTEELPPPPELPRTLVPFSHREWLSEKPFRLVLGAGFVGGLYRHLGLLQALEDAALKPRDIVGVSAGAIVGAMYGCLPLRGPGGVEDSLMTLHPQDFLDPCWATLVAHGAVCPGHAFERKLERTFAPALKTDLAETCPRVAVEVYDTQTGITSLIDNGSIVQAVRWSASLPILFAGDRFIDGGWIDQNGLLGMVPGQRAINHRIFEGSDQGGFMQWRINRPKPILAPSTDAEHRTLHFVGPEKITEANFIFALQDEGKLNRVTNHSRETVAAWLAQPA